MRTEHLQAIIVQLEKRVADIEAECLIRKHISEYGLDLNNAADYALAAMEVLRYVAPERFERKMHLGKYGSKKLLISNNNCVFGLDGAAKGEYNDDKIIGIIGELQGRIELLEKNEYGFGGDLIRGAKDWLVEKGRKALRKVRGESRITNNSGEDIAVVGLKEEGGNIISMFLSNGDNSEDYFYDTDGVIIMPYQKYYKPGTNEVVSQGAIKIHDTVKATVTKEGRILVFRAEYGFAEYLSSVPVGWPTPEGVIG